jgi:ATP-grasp domain
MTLETAQLGALAWNNSMFLLRRFDRRFAPVGLYYLPILAWLAAQRFRGFRLRYLTICNPALPMSGLFGLSKVDMWKKCLALDILQPDTEIASSSTAPTEREFYSARTATAERVIAKPEFGARSRGIRIFSSRSDARHFVANNKTTGHWLIQQFVEGDEYSIFLIRDQVTQELNLHGVVLRERAIITGDGQTSIAGLIRGLPARIRPQHRRLHTLDLTHVPSINERVILTTLGIHSLGAEFRELSAAESQLALPLVKQLNVWTGLNYARIDFIRETTTGRNVLLEVNGSFSEPLHAYDPNRTLAAFYNVFFNVLRKGLQRGEYESRRGVILPSRMEFISSFWKGYRRYRKL